MAENEQEVRPLAEVNADIERVKAEIRDLEQSRGSLTVRMAEALRGSKKDNAALANEHGTVHAKVLARQQLLDWLEGERYQSIRSAALDSFNAALASRRQAHVEEQQARAEFSQIQQQLAIVGSRIMRSQNRRLALQQTISFLQLDATVTAGLDAATLSKLRADLHDELVRLRRDADGPSIPEPTRGIVQGAGKASQDAQPAAKSRAR